MYIAIIADNIATRKHMERLLGRTSDAVMSEIGNLYIEAYGEPETMWPVIKRYDLFFVDITMDEHMRLAVLNRLSNLGLDDRIVICRSQDADPVNGPDKQGLRSVMHPLSVEILSEVVLQIYKETSLSRVSKHVIEFRSQQNTEYIETRHILYAALRDHVVDVHLDDGRTINHLGTLQDFKRLVENYEEFQPFGKDTYINTNHIIRREPREITLSGGHVIKLSLLGRYRTQ